MAKKWFSIVSAITFLLSGTIAQASDHTTNLIASAHKAQSTITKRKVAGAAWTKKANMAPFKNNHYVLTGSLPVNGYHTGSPVVVIVDKGSHFTYVLQQQGSKIVRCLTVSNAIGSQATPTPPGRYTISLKKMDPKWIPPKTIDPDQKPVEPFSETKKNPLGVAAIYLDKFDIDLHGTNEPKLIRSSSSHGCVRHSNSDITQLYSMINPGDVVYIVNKFRGKVLQRADFNHHANRVAQYKAEPLNLDKNGKDNGRHIVEVEQYLLDT